MEPVAVEVQKIAREVALDSRPVRRRIGLILLATDHTTEPDFARICPREELGIYSTRIGYENPATPENLLRMQPRLTESAALVLPGESLDALCYSCTAASVLMGDESVEAALQAAKPGVPVVTPSAAARIALKQLGASRISILTPYVPRTTAPFGEYFSRHGFDVVNLVCFGLSDDREIARVTPGDIVAAAREVVHATADALFISCTALRAAQVVEKIERAIGRPVVTSNQASAWLSLRRAGFRESVPGYGRLLSMPAPD